MVQIILINTPNCLIIYPFLTPICHLWYFPKKDFKIWISTILSLSTTTPLTCNDYPYLSSHCLFSLTSQPPPLFLSQISASISNVRVFSISRFQFQCFLGFVFFQSSSMLFLPTLSRGYNTGTTIWRSQRLNFFFHFYFYFIP